MTSTQAEYLKLYATGLTMKEIATTKCVNISTVSRTLKRAYISKPKPPPPQKMAPALCEYAFSCHTCPNNAACDTESVHIRKIRIQSEPQPELETPPELEAPRRGRYSY